MKHYRDFLKIYDFHICNNIDALSIFQDFELTPVNSKYAPLPELTLIEITIAGFYFVFFFHL